MSEDPGKPRILDSQEGDLEPKDAVGVQVDITRIWQWLKGKLKDK